MTGPRYSQAGLQALKAGSRIVPARQQLNLLAAVEGLPPAHDCPGIYDCIRHPRWYVWRGRQSGYWYAGHRELWIGIGPFPTHAEAVANATSRARADQLAAITSSEGAGR